MAGTGGAREGAGRPKGLRNKSTLEIKELLDECVDWNVLVSKLVELTNGIEIVKVNEKGQSKVYENPPDSHAAKILLEYRFGKPSQPIEGKLEVTEIIITKKIV